MEDLIRNADIYVDLVYTAIRLMACRLDDLCTGISAFLRIYCSYKSNDQGVFL